MTKYFLNILILISSLEGLSQKYFFGDIQSRYKIERLISLDSENQHSISKPFLISNQKNEFFQKGIWNYASVRSSSKFTFLPFLSLNQSPNISFESPKLNYATGLQINYENAKFFGQIRVGHQKGFVNSEDQFFSIKRPFVPFVGYVDDTLKMTYNKQILQGVLSFKANKYIVLSTGLDKNTFGDGYRSLWLSDFAPIYPFLKLESTFWKIKYINLWSLHEDQYSKGFSNKKWASSHLLSYNVNKWLNLSLFESVIWQDKDTLLNRGFDINYLNPFVFFRPVEFGIGSSDNSLLGAGLKLTFNDHFLLYSSFILDEFLFSEIKNQTGWWGNKYGVQLGIKTFDLFNKTGLYSITEFNLVRPFTYSHISSKQNYGHKNHSLAHPLESNFKEYLFLIGFQNNNLDFSIQYHYQQYGIDSSNQNFGGNMFESYVNRVGDYEQKIGQGNLVNQHLFIAQISYLIAGISNTKLFLQFNLRKAADSYGSSKNNNFLRIGISSRLWQQLQDY